MSTNLYVGETFDALCSTKLGINILLTGDGGDYVLSRNPYIFDSIYRRNKSNAKKMNIYHLNKLLEIHIMIYCQSL